MPAMTIKNIVVLVSGRGSNLQALLFSATNERWEIEPGARIAAVISDRDDAEALGVARAHGIPVHVVSHAEPTSCVALEASLSQVIDGYAPALVVLAGFMRVLTPQFVRRYLGRLINIHPSLLPSFPGLKTHQRALQAGVRIHGATVHFVSAGVDAGAIIAQAAVPVFADDDEASLAARVLQQEHRLLPRVVRRVLEGRVQLSQQRAVLRDVARDELSLLVS